MDFNKVLSCASFVKSFRAFALGPSFFVCSLLLGGRCRTYICSLPPRLHDTILTSAPSIFSYFRESEQVKVRQFPLTLYPARFCIDRAVQRSVRIARCCVNSSLIRTKADAYKNLFLQFFKCFGFCVVWLPPLRYPVVISLQSWLFCLSVGQFS